MKKSEQNLEKLTSFIDSYTRKNGYPPSIREMNAELNVSSTSTVKYYLDILEKRNIIKRNHSQNRAIEIIKKSNIDKYSMNGISIPLIGNITAGAPILAQENFIGTYNFSKDLFNGEEQFMLVVSGDSMINAGIYNGDYIVVKKQNTAENGEIVAALIDDSATVKRFYKEKENIRLQPENPAYSPIISPAIQILGKVVGVVRKIH